jgi:hypothetical protein
MKQLPLKNWRTSLVSTPLGIREDGGGKNGDMFFLGQQRKSDVCINQQEDLNLNTVKSGH